MLLSKRGFSVPSEDVEVTEHAILHSSYTVCIHRRIGVQIDTRMLSPSRCLKRRSVANRSNLVISLEGEGTRIHRGEREWHLLPGTVTPQSHRSFHIRNDSDCTVLILEWADGFAGSKCVESEAPGSLAPRTLARLRQAALTLTDRSAPIDDVAKATQSVLGLLRAEGFPFETVGPHELQEPVEPWAARLCKEIDRAVSDLPRQPMLVDLEERLGWPERRIRTRLGELRERYLMNHGSWREIVRGWRFMTALALMSRPQATTEEVAALAGYRSAIALCDAFREAGLPSPGSVRDELRRLG